MKTMKTRPTLKSPCVADQYHGPNERIAEFSFPNGKGGLIALRQHPELCIVDVYRCDEGIEVRTANPKDWNDPARTPVLPGPIKTVGDLIAKLQTFDPSLPVLRETEEFGACGIEDCYQINNAIDTDTGTVSAFVFIGPSAELETE